MILKKHVLTPQKHELSKAILSLFISMLQKIGKITLPCFTPLATVTCVEMVLPQRKTFAGVYTSSTLV